MIFSKMSHLKQRLAVSGFVIAIIISAIYLSPYAYFRPFFAMITAALIGSSVWEFYHMAKAKGYQPMDTLGIVFTIAYVISVFISTQSASAQTLPEITLLLMLIASFTYYFVKGTAPFANIALTVFGIVYLAIPLSCIISINYFFPPESTQDGRWWLLYLIAVTKMTDTGAYFFGKKLGQTKLAPYISPRKTWEGAMGGFVTALATSVFFLFLADFFYDVSPLNLTFVQSIWLGAVISVLAQFGDLAESLLKRDMGVKDSNQLPGLGGMLDIVDSLVFTAPFVYIFLRSQV